MFSMFLRSLVAIFELLDCRIQLSKTMLTPHLSLNKSTLIFQLIQIEKI